MVICQYLSTNAEILCDHSRFREQFLEHLDLIVCRTVPIKENPAAWISANLYHVPFKEHKIKVEENVYL